MTNQHSQEQQTERAIKVRQVTEVHGNFNEEERGEPGKFSFQFILDNGAEEALVMPTASDGKLLRDLIHDADALYYDLDRGVVIFGKVD